MSVLTNAYSNLSDQTKFRLNEINKIKDCFNSEIQEREKMSKKISQGKRQTNCYYFLSSILILLDKYR